jgi:hypothetical protein
MGLRCFWIEPNSRTRLSLRRYTNRMPCPLRPGEYSYHNAAAVFCEVPVVGGRDYDGPHTRADVPAGGPWPEACACGYRFVEADEWQVFSERLYARRDNGAIVTLRDAVPGAMWNADWLAHHPDYTGPDGRSISVNCPNGHEWTIDSRARNCDSPCATCGKPYHQHYSEASAQNLGHHFIESRPHKCWVRHGEPPNLTVDKNGTTCGAGAGSIQAGNYHGFLRNGEFKDA